jgi:hypothetical protein
MVSEEYDKMMSKRKSNQDMISEIEIKVLFSGLIKEEDKPKQYDQITKDPNRRVILLQDLLK